MKSLLLLLTFIVFALGEAFFLIADKHEPILFCIKICPLYCSPRRDKRDASLIYFDHDSYFPFPDVEEQPPHPYHVGHYLHCKTSPKPTSLEPTSPEPTSPRPTSPRPTSSKPTSPEPTTEELTWICEVCQKKCGYPAK